MLAGHGLLNELCNVCMKFDRGSASQERLFFTLKNTGLDLVSKREGSTSFWLARMQYPKMMTHNLRAERVLFEAVVGKGVDTRL